MYVKVEEKKKKAIDGHPSSPCPPKRAMTSSISRIYEITKYGISADCHACRLLDKATRRRLSLPSWTLILVSRTPISAAKGSSMTVVTTRIDIRASKRKKESNVRSRSSLDFRPYY